MEQPGINNSSSKSVTLWGVLGCGGLLVVVVVILFPILARPTGGCSQKLNCQSNMKQIGAAFKMYLEDWHGTYPTNRPRLASGRLGPISSDVKLTPVAELTPGKRLLNLSWVEALYPYMEMPSEESNGAWECRAASTDMYPDGSKTAYTTYVMNMNLVEQPEQIIRASDRLMLVRKLIVT